MAGGGGGWRAVQYEPRAWTDNAVAMFETHSTLRRNVLDAFNRAGVEIRTPRILGHRDASGLAIPPEAFPDRPTRGGIAVHVDQRDQVGGWWVMGDATGGRGHEVHLLQLHAGR